MLDIFGFHEVLTAKFIKAVVCEFLATAILIISACGSVVTMDAGKPLSTMTSSLTSGMTVAFIVHTFNHVSGAHINPAITLGFLVTGNITVAKTLAYVSAQCCGSVAGSAALWYVVPSAWRGTLGSTVFAEGVTLGQGFAIEVMCTFLLMLGVSASSDRNRTDHGGSTSLTVGLIVFMQIAWAGKPTGCSMNPARSLGPAVLSGTWENHWVYWVAPALGAVLGSLFYQHILVQSAPPKLATTNIEMETVGGDFPNKDSEKRKSVTDKSDVTENTPTFRYIKEGFSNSAVTVDKL